MKKYKGTSFAVRIFAIGLVIFGGLFFLSYEVGLRAGYFGYDLGVSLGSAAIVLAGLLGTVIADCLKSLERRMARIENLGR